MSYEPIFEYKIKEEENTLTIRRPQPTFDPHFVEVITKVPGVRHIHTPSDYIVIVDICSPSFRSVSESVCEAIDTEMEKREKESIRAFLKPKIRPTHIAIFPLEENRIIEIEARVTKEVEEFEFWGRPVRETVEEVEFIRAIDRDTGEVIPEIGEEILQEDLEFLAY